MDTTGELSVFERHLRGFVLGLVALGCFACGPDSGTKLGAATSFGVVRATSGSDSYSADALFLSPVGSNHCEVAEPGGGCLVTRCDEAPEPGVTVSTGVVTIQGRETVVLNPENEYQAQGKQTLYDSGEEVLVDLTASDTSPAVRRQIKAPSGTSLTSPVPNASKHLELSSEQDLGLAWVPGDYGLLKLYVVVGLTSLSCDFTLSDGTATIPSSTLTLLPPSDGSDSSVAFWTEQSDVARLGDWEFLMLLLGEAQSGEFTGVEIN